MEVHGGIARIIRGRGRRRGGLGVQALQRRPGLDQRAIHGDGLIRQQPGLLGVSHHGLEDAPGDVVLEQPLAVLAEGTVIEDRLIQTHVQNPAEEDVVVQLLTEEPPAPEGEQGDQPRALQQPLRRNRRTPHLAIQLVEDRRQRSQDLVREGLDGSQRMGCGNPRFRRDIAEQGLLRVELPAQRAASWFRGCLRGHHTYHGTVKTVQPTFSTSC